MTTGTVRVAPDSTGKVIDTSELLVDGNTAQRQRTVLGDDSDGAGLAHVTNTQPAATDYALAVREVEAANLRDLSDAVAYLAKAIEQRLPMPDSLGRQRVDITSVSGLASNALQVNISSNLSGNSLVGVGGAGNAPTYSLNHMPFALSNQAAAHLYAQITVV